MQSVGSFFSTVSKLYSEINPATLSGAIDIVVVEQSNGDLACSPFHVRFGKLSILRPQEKVVEVTVNGRVVDFPMKVGDAGEAFFVFETEKEVPEEFATSPLAGPSQTSKTSEEEEEIDFLDLSQGGGGVAGADTGYVSAHSGHGTEFDEDEHENRSPQPDMGSKQDYVSASAHYDDRDLKTDSVDVLENHFDLGGLQPMRPRYLLLSEHSSESRFSFSISLPSSPVLKARDIMENFQPIDSAGPFEESSSTESQGSRRYQSSSPVRASAKEGEGEQGAPYSRKLLTAHDRDDVIMDMTGYKTDDSAETDLDSDDPSDSRGDKVSPRSRRKKKRSKRPFKVLPFSAIDDQDMEDLASQIVDPQTTITTTLADPRLPTRPIQPIRNRIISGASTRKRSASLPAVLGRVLLAPRYHRHHQTRVTPQVETLSFTLRISTANDIIITITTTADFWKMAPVKKMPAAITLGVIRIIVHPATPSRPKKRSHYQTPRAQDTEWTWGWGSLPVKNESMDDMGDKDADLVSPQSRHVSLEMPETPKPVLNEMEIDGVIYRVAVSLCPGDDFGKDLVASEALFATNQISFEEFSKDPLKLLNNKSLVCLINDRYFTWAAAGPYLASLLLFRKPLSDATLHQLSIKDVRHLSELTDKPQETSTRFGAISRWLRGSQASNQLSSVDRAPHARSSTAVDTSVIATTTPFDRIEGQHSVHDNFPGPDNEPMVRSTSMPIDAIMNTTNSFAEEEIKRPNQEKKSSSKRYAKTLRLTSDQLKSLNLQKGANTLSFSVTSSYQGKAVCSAKLFLWEHDYQVVISDIDGTITKSDALGHIFTMAGKDWTHSGVAKLYTDITNNGYHILYLTSRAIGQADYTRKYLKNVEQDNYQLPDGPVIMSPDRLMTAFHREVIMRKPEEFKMACLRDIRRLFEDRNPFYAGFGNRITDALSYRSVNVPSSRIFTIDSGGEVKLELLSNYKSSYLALNDLVNEIFPGTKQVPEFNDWNYWKQPLPTLDLPLPLPQSRPISQPVPLDGSGGLSRLGVIRSFTSSLTSSGPLKKRPSMPAFSSTPSTPPMSHSSLLSPNHAQLSSSPPPPNSAPAGLQLVDRTRRLSLSLMKYGSHSASASALTLPMHNNNNSIDRPSYAIAAAASAAQATMTATEPTGYPGSRLRGMSFTSSQVHVPSGLRNDGGDHEDPERQHRRANSGSPPRSSGTNVHPLDIPGLSSSPPSSSSSLLKKASSFSVSPPQLANRLTDTVLPFLRGRSSRTESGRHHSISPSLLERGISHKREEDEVRTPLNLEGELEYDEYTGHEEDGGDEGEIHEEGDEEEYDEGLDLEEDLEEDLDDVELNIDAPFL
ncbi:hypothetical protein BGZ83_011039 [Gryganskiella cystojenkinii]|nr:hypothetical protein BGZ83_011039 [Gryganskiella cystojenkinii]